MSRHGESNLVSIGGVVQSFRIGGKTQVVVALQQGCGEDHLIAGSDGIHLRSLMSQDLPGIQTVRAGNGELSGNAFQLQRNLGLCLTSGDGQSALNGIISPAFQQDRMHYALIREGCAVHGQAPEVLPALHGCKGHCLY